MASEANRMFIIEASEKKKKKPIRIGEQQEDFLRRF